MFSEENEHSFATLLASPHKSAAFPRETLLVSNPGVFAEFLRHFPRIPSEKQVFFEFF